MRLTRLPIDTTPNGYDKTASILLSVSSFLSFASIWFSLESISRKRHDARERAAEIRRLEDAVQ